MPRLLLILSLLVTGFSEHDCAAQRQPKSGSPLVLVHYMPWFESKEISGKWGWHWTMGHFNPDVIDCARQAEYRSH